MNLGEPGTVAMAAGISSIWAAVAAKAVGLFTTFMEVKNLMGC